MDKEIMLYIVWKDHSSDDRAWVRAADVAPLPQIIHSVGFFVKETEDTLVLAGMQGTDEDGTEISVMQNILKSCIMDKKELVAKKTRKKAA